MSGSQKLKLVPSWKVVVRSHILTTDMPDVPRTVQELIERSRSVYSPQSLQRFVSEMRHLLPGPRHQHEGVLSRMAVQQFQNWLLDHNSQWKLTDGQLLAVMRVEFPSASGKVFTGSPEEGLAIVRGIRAHYNRDGHNGPSPQSRGLPLSISYGEW